MSLRKPKRGIFITGTDTEVGKTYAASLIARSLAAAGHRVGVYKPVASGCARQDEELVSEDAVMLWENAGRNGSLEDVCPQRFTAPIAPHLAAKQEGQEVDPELLRNGIEKWSTQCDVVIVEGAGGLMSPVTDEEYVADLAYDFGYPLVVVVPNALGCINQTLQTLIAAATFQDGLEIAGVILNDVDPDNTDVSRDTNRQEISNRINVPVLGQIQFGAESIDEAVNWWEIAQSVVTEIQSEET